MSILSRLLCRRHKGERDLIQIADLPFFLEGERPPAPPTGPETPAEACEWPELAARVARLLERDVRPALALHAGNCQLVDVKRDGSVLLRLTGACHGCAMSGLTLKRGVESRMRDVLPEVTSVEAV